MKTKITNANTLCFSGHRPSSLPWGYNENDDRCIAIKNEIRNLIIGAIDIGYTHFISGMAEGIDIMVAEIVLGLKYEYNHITLECAIPFPKQSARWSFYNQERYNEIISLADKITVISPTFYKGCMHVRNKYMVDHSSLLIAVFNGSDGGTKNTIELARQKNLEVWLVNC